MATKHELKCVSKGIHKRAQCSCGWWHLARTKEIAERLHAQHVETEKKSGN